MASCTNCGKSLGVSEKVCQGCGAKVPEQSLGGVAPLRSSAPPPPVNVPKAPAPPKARPQISTVQPQSPSPQKKGNSLGIVLGLLIVIGFAYWYWSSKEIENQLAIEQANQAAELQKQQEEAAKLAEMEAAKLAEIEAARKAAAEEAAAKAEEEKAALKAEADRVKAEKEAALDEARRAQNQLKAQEMDRLAREHQLAHQRDLMVNMQQQRTQQFAPPPVQATQPVQQPNVTQQVGQAAVNPNGYKVKFKGTFGGTVTKRIYPTEAMKDQAIKLWDDKKLILELDGTTTNPFSSNPVNSIIRQ